jgi:hypothetical protein
MQRHNLGEISCSYDVSKNSCNKLSGQFKLKAVECAKSLDVQLQRKMSRSTQGALSDL